MFSTLATRHQRAMLKYIAIGLTTIVYYCYSFTVHAQSPPADTAKGSPVSTDSSAGTSAGAGEITKIEDCQIPFEMAYKIKHMQPSALDSMRIEFQKIVKEDEEEKIITIRMRYLSDHLQGYMTKAPIRHSNKYIVVSMPINVKIEWTCVPDSTHPNKHQAATLAEMKHVDTTEHCKHWVQADDGTDMVKQITARKIPSKNLKHPVPWFGRVVDFITFKKQKYFLIPIDQTFKELLDSAEPEKIKSRKSKKRKPKKADVPEMKS